MNRTLHQPHGQGRIGTFGTIVAIRGGTLESKAYHWLGLRLGLEAMQLGV
eukprot:COSAG06_NODE_2274_length_7194_cov_81.563073_3_plen_50_part_00